MNFNLFDLFSFQAFICMHCMYIKFVYVSLEIYMQVLVVGYVMRMKTIGFSLCIFVYVSFSLYMLVLVCIC